jgi:hypothetical protein
VKGDRAVMYSTLGKSTINKSNMSCFDGAFTIYWFSFMKRCCFLQKLTALNAYLLHGTLFACKIFAFPVGLCKNGREFLNQHGLLVFFFTCN